MTAAITGTCTRCIGGTPMREGNEVVCINCGAYLGDLPRRQYVPAPENVPPEALTERQDAVLRHLRRAHTWLPTTRLAALTGTRTGGIRNTLVWLEKHGFVVSKGGKHGMEWRARL